MSACQELPKEYQGEEGKKKLEKYAKQFVKGEVRLSPEVEKHLPEEPYFLIIAVRKPDSPMPVAVLRVKNPEFPYRFKVYGKHKIRQDRMIEGDLIVSARISKSPTADIKGGDLVGSAQAKAGDKNVVIVIEDVIPQGGGPGGLQSQGGGSS